MKTLHRSWQVVGFDDEAVPLFQFGPACVPVFHGGARGNAHQGQGTGNDNTKRGRGGSKKEKKLESYLPKKPRSYGERRLNTDTTTIFSSNTTGRHQQRWRGPQTRRHRTAVVG
jgi:hypothetical protein